MVSLQSRHIKISQKTEFRQKIQAFGPGADKDNKVVLTEREKEGERGRKSFNK